MLWSVVTQVVVKTMPCHHLKKWMNTKLSLVEPSVEAANSHFLITSKQVLGVEGSKDAAMGGNLQR